MSFLLKNRLMIWREPNAYRRKFFSFSALTKIYGLNAIGLLIISPAVIRHNSQHPIAILYLLYLFLCLVVFLGQWFGTTVIQVKENVIWKSGNSSGRCYFTNIKNCNVNSDFYKGTRFFVLKFDLKEQNKSLFFKPKQISEIAMPENVNLEKFLQILQEKGVNVIEG
jgi:hypothetical protein